MCLSCLYVSAFGCSVAFLVLCILAVVGCCFCRRMRAKAASPSFGLKQTSGAPVEMSALLPRQRAREFPIHKVRFLQELGEGAFGELPTAGNSGRAHSVSYLQG